MLYHQGLHWLGNVLASKTPLKENGCKAEIENLKGLMGCKFDVIAKETCVSLLFYWTLKNSNKVGDRLNKDIFSLDKTRLRDLMEPHYVPPHTFIELIQRNKLSQILDIYQSVSLFPLQLNNNMRVFRKSYSPWSTFLFRCGHVRDHLELILLKSWTIISFFLCFSKIGGMVMKIFFTYSTSL